MNKALHGIWGVLAAAGIIAGAGVLAYSNTWHVPFLADDFANIVNSPSIKRLWPFFQLIVPPDGLHLEGRPIANVTFAINYAISGLSVWSYHAFNLIVHVCAGLFLSGIIRRTLLSERMREKYGRDSTLLAFFSALIWLAHPLNTEAVTYITQRQESLMGLFFLMALYCAIRGWAEGSSGAWHLAAALAGVLGAGSKEVMAVAPVIVLFYDLVFVHHKDGPAQALFQSCRLYSGLAMTWLLLGVLLLGGATAHTTGQAGCTPFEYLRTQAQVIAHYLKSAVWPGSLCFDYAWPVASLREAAPYAAVITVLVLASLAALWKRRPIGFLGAWFFGILAPTSRILPLPYLAWDYRMYLPLASVAVLFVTGAYRICLNKRFFFFASERAARIFCLMGTVAIFLILCIFTHARNEVYQSGISLWTDTVRKSPKNFRAYLNLGAAFQDVENQDEALACFYEAARIKPDFAEALRNAGGALIRMDKNQEAVEVLERALKIRPQYPEAHLNLGTALLGLGKNLEARAHLRRALMARPDLCEARLNLGLAEITLGNRVEAIRNFRLALCLNPGYYKAHINMGTALASEGRYVEAIRHYEEALKTSPPSARLHLQLAGLYYAIGDEGNALIHLRVAKATAGGANGPPHARPYTPQGG